MRLFKSIKKIVIFAIVLTFTAITIIWLYWGNNSIQVTPVSIASSKVPKAFHGFTIAHISDLHNKEFGEGQNQLLTAVKNASPDMIAITGDFIDWHRTNIKKAMEFINGAVKIAPVYYVTGNHEANSDKYLKLEAQMRDAGVVLLRNKGITIHRSEDSIRVLGVDDPAFETMNNRIGWQTELMNAKLKSIKGNGSYTVLLSHRPELLNIYAANNIDLVLTGHAHGGQIRLPFIGGLFSPNQGFFPRYTNGVHDAGQTKMVVSRGLGNSDFLVRVNNRPELVIVTLQ